MNIQIDSWNLNEIRGSVVKEYFAHNPSATLKNASIELGISERTIYRYMDTLNFGLTRKVLKDRHKKSKTTEKVLKYLEGLGYTVILKNKE